MSARELVVLALQASIIATVFGFGLKATRDDVLYVVRRPSLLLRSLLAMFVSMPLLAVVLEQTFAFRPSVEAALIALAISPVPPLLPKKHEKVGGEASYGLGLMVTMAVLSLATIPLTVHLLGVFYDRPFAMTPGGIAKLILVMAVCPLLAGMLCGRFIPRLAQRISAPVLLLGERLIPIVGVVILVALVMFVVVALLVGHLLGGPDPASREVLAVSTACRHPGIAIAVASANANASANTSGEDLHVPAAILLYLVVSIIATIPYMRWQAKRLAAGR